MIGNISHEIAENWSALERNWLRDKYPGLVYTSTDDIMEKFN